MITYHHEIEQDSEEWKAIRLGLITASVVGELITPSTLKVADNQGSRGLLYDLAAQRVTGYVEPSYFNDDMLRGHDDEIEARNLYSRHIAPVEKCGFITREVGGLKFGYSPDGLVGVDGLIEVKSKNQKLHMRSVIEGEVPKDHIMQIQMGLFVSGREWCDYVGHCGGMAMVRYRVYLDENIQDALLAALLSSEHKIQSIIKKYQDMVEFNKFILTERKQSGDTII